MSTRPGVLNTVRDVYSYEVLSSTEWNSGSSFTPNFFLELQEENLELKSKL